MASRVSNNLLGSIKGRFASTKAAVQHFDSVQLAKQEPKLTKLPNGIRIASVENNSPISRVSVVVNAGTRFEDGNNLGINHCLRVAAGLSTQKSSEFKIAKSIQQIGGNLSVTTTREHIYYNIDCIRDDVNNMLQFLSDITTVPAFKPWEVDAIQTKLSLDLAILKTQPHAKLVEMLHQTAFRDKLGRSLYAPSFMIGNYSSEQLLNYMTNNFTGGRMAVVATGVDHDDLVNQVKTFKPFLSGDKISDPAVYHGRGEVRKNIYSPLSYVAIGVEGPSLNSADLLPVSILKYVMGCGPSLKYSRNSDVSKLGKGVGKMATGPFAVSCFSNNYSDSGLFGFMAVAKPDDIGNVLKSAFQQFRDTTRETINTADIQRAKNQLKMDLLLAAENQEGVVHDLAEQTFTQQQIVPVASIVQRIDTITDSDINEVAKKIVNGKPTMAAIGNLSKTPYLDELYK